jgi:Domain of unknown function (DUF4328)
VPKRVLVTLCYLAFGFPRPREALADARVDTATVVTQADHPLGDLYLRSDDAVAAYRRGDYESPTGRARWAKWLFALTIVANAASLLALGAQREVFNRGIGGFTLAEWNRSASRIDALNLLRLLLLVATAVVFLRWLHLCYRNVRVLGLSTRFTPGWAVGYWFIPVLSLFRPKQVIDELWERTDDALVGQKSGLIPVWWGMWLIGNAIEWVGTRLGSSTLDEVKTRNSVFLTAHVLQIGAAVCAYWLVGRLTERQDARASRA